MRGGRHLLLLAVFVVLARCQQNPQVSVSPPLEQIFPGDLFYLSCDNSGSNVKWYFNNIEQTLTSKTWKIAAASPKHTGLYQCESNGQKSSTRSISVHDYLPKASLSIQTGQPVIQPGGSVILQLDNNDGLQGWRCWVYTGEKEKKIILRLKPDSVSHTFQPSSRNVSESIFWCTDEAQTHRSNQITVRTSEKDIALEMYPLPAVAGDSLTLRCLTWGTDRVTNTVFYKDNIVIKRGPNPTYQISNVAESEQGKYKCDAMFYHHDRSRGPPYHLVSDNQDVFVQVTSMRAVLSANVPLSCSCPNCPSEVSYLWYHMNDDGQPSALKDHIQGSMMPKESGTYACRAVWSNGMSLLSNSYVYEPPKTNIFVIVIIVLVILGFLISATAFYFWYKKRNATGPIYEDIGLTSRDKGDNKYEVLQKSRGAQAESEYHTLNPEVQGREKVEGQYEPLKKEGMKEGMYHTLGMEEAAGGTGGYEALKKEEMTKEVYHTLEIEGAAGGAGGYEALKKEGMAKEVYHTLGMEGAAGGN